MLRTLCLLALIPLALPTAAAAGFSQGASGDAGPLGHVLPLPVLLSYDDDPSLHGTPVGTVYSFPHAPSVIYDCVPDAIVPTSGDCHVEVTDGMGEIAYTGGGRLEYFTGDFYTRDGNPITLRVYDDANNILHDGTCSPAANAWTTCSVTSPGPGIRRIEILGAAGQYGWDTLDMWWGPHTTLLLHVYEDMTTTSFLPIGGFYPGFSYSGDARTYCDQAFPNIVASSAPCVAFDWPDGSPATILADETVGVLAFSANFGSLDGSNVEIFAYDADGNLLVWTDCPTFAGGLTPCEVDSFLPIAKIVLVGNEDQFAWDDATFHATAPPVPELPALVLAGMGLVGIALLARRRA